MRELRLFMFFIAVLLFYDIEAQYETKVITDLNVAVYKEPDGKSEIIAWLSLGEKIETQFITSYCALPQEDNNTPFVKVKTHNGAKGFIRLRDGFTSEISFEMGPTYEIPKGFSYCLVSLKELRLVPTEISLGELFDEGHDLISTTDNCLYIVTAQRQLETGLVEGQRISAGWRILKPGFHQVLFQRGEYTYYITTAGLTEVPEGSVYPSSSNIKPYIFRQRNWKTGNERHREIVKTDLSQYFVRGDEADLCFIGDIDKDGLLELVLRTMSCGYINIYLEENNEGVFELQ